MRSDGVPRHPVFVSGPANRMPVAPHIAECRYYEGNSSKGNLPMAWRNVNRFRALAVAMSLAASMAMGAEETDAFGGRALEAGEKFDGKTLTVDELIACIDLQRAFKGKASDADLLEIEADLAESRYRGLSMIIGAERQTLDASDQREIDAFNAKVAEHGTLVDAYNDLVVRLNAALADHDALIERFNPQCTTSTYYASDLNKAYNIRQNRLAASIAEAAKREGKP